MHSTVMHSIVKRMQTLLEAGRHRQQPASHERALPPAPDQGKCSANDPVSERPNLPVNRPDVAREPEHRDQAGQASPYKAGQPAQVLHSTVMMIMMNGETNRSLAQAFRELGYEVHTVEEISDAVTSLDREQPSVIIVCSPSGPQACAILRQSTPAPILALLPEADDSGVLATLDAGADDCQRASIGIDEAVMRAQAISRRNRPTPGFGQKPGV